MAFEALTDNRYDIAIIGGGASGMTAAINIKRRCPKADVVIVEKNDILGRKIFATGNGRCNLSNNACSEKETVLEFFESIGVVARIDADGRIYPYTEDASDVADALVEEINSLGIEYMTDAPVKSIAFDERSGRYRVLYSCFGNDHSAAKNMTFDSKIILLATGGKAAPCFGTTGDGYRFARSLYHSVTRLAPALTAVETKEDTSGFSGIRAKARASLIAGGGTLFESLGEVQFTDYGISGIVVFDMSRYMVIPEGRTLVNGFDDYSIELDFIPSTSLDEAECMAKSGVRIVRKKIRDYIEKKTGGDPERTAMMLKHFSLHPSGLRGWDHAEITKGGVPLTEIDMSTMRSKFMPGLYFAGEIIDYDGPSGGFNLQNAWETGIKAGISMAEEFTDK